MVRIRSIRKKVEKHLIELHVDGSDPQKQRLPPVGRNGCSVNGSEAAAV